MGEARVPNPTSHLRSIHQRTITALRVQQRLTGDDPLWTNQLHIAMKKLLARIRITEEAIADSADGAFTAACRDEITGLVRDAAARGWVEP